MREAYYDVSWVEENETAPDAAADRFCGLNLGYDRCGEHEGGIERLSRVFGLPQGPFKNGIESRQVTLRPAGLLFQHFRVTRTIEGVRRTTPVAFLVFERNGFRSPMSPERQIKAWRRNPPGGLPFVVTQSEAELRRYPDAANNHIRTRWGENGFGITVAGANEVARLQKLYEAFDRLDVCLSLSDGLAAFGGAGFCLTIASRISTATRAAVLARDLAHRRLIEAAEATGIEVRLKAAGKRWFALMPGWADKEQSAVRFFLNPFEQRTNNSGWFTVAELDAWVAGSGPIPKAPASAMAGA